MSKRKFTEKHVPKGVTPKFSHLRNEDRTIFETICVLIDNSSGAILARGRSRVSPRDNPSKKIGRAISVGRAMKKFTASQNTFSRFRSIEV